MQRQWVTGSFSRLTGYSTDEFDRIGREGLIHPEDLADAMKFIDGPIGESEHEFRIITKSGEIRHLRERLLIEKRSDGGTHAYGATRDITEEKEAEQALQASRERLNQSQRLESLGRLAGGIAHDFNNLLMVIVGYSEQLVAGTETGSRPQRHASEIRRAAERAGSLTRQLLAFSRKQALQPRTVQLNALINDMSEMLGRLVPEDIEMTFELDPELGSIKIDPNHFERALMNLVVNACDAIDRDGKITIRTSSGVPENVKIDDRPDTNLRQYVRLEVTDNGRGMDAETQKYVFEPFFTTKSEGQGTGLGMAAVYGIVTQSDGYIDVASEPNSGTTVSIYLPEVDEPVDATVEADPGIDIHEGCETLLLVEDESMVREMVRDALSERGYTVLEASCPSKALAISQEHRGPIDLLITDVVMPEMDGKRLSDLVLASRPKTRVLFMSGYPSEFVGRHGVLETGVSLLTKPISLEQLSRKARELLDAP